VSREPAGGPPSTGRPPPGKPPPLDEDPGKGQFYFPGRPKGCLSAVVVLALVAVAAMS
jgi:hypothetical protein